MIFYLVQRVGQALLVLLMVTFVVFAVMRYLPGDPILLYIEGDYAGQYTAEQIDDLREQFGLNRSVPVQYLSWLGGVLRGDLGKSIYRGSSVTQEIGNALPVTLQIGLLAFVLSQIVGIPVGILCAIRRGTWIDTSLTVIANIGITAPVFWVGIIGVYVFGLKLGWLPIQGYVSPSESIGDFLFHAVMPVVTLALLPLAQSARQTRSAILETVHQDYIRTAWAKGLPERKVILRHALKNGMIPVVTLIGVLVPVLFSGSVLVETVFNIPGIGSLAVKSLFQQDYAIVQGVVLVVCSVVVLVNLLVDLSYGWLDPRVRLAGEEA
jgi:peptide/nickel transport system permease protein